MSLLSFPCRTGTMWRRCRWTWDMLPQPLPWMCTVMYQIGCSVKAQPEWSSISQAFPEWNQANKMNNPLLGTAKFSTQRCQRKQTDGVTVVVKNTAEDFEAAKAYHKNKNRLETLHFKTISCRWRRLRTLGLRFWRPYFMNLLSIAAEQNIYIVSFV